MDITRDFTATVFIVHQEHTLLHRHKDLGILVPPGGHIEPGELPQEAAIREAREEAGLNIELYDSDPDFKPKGNARKLICPVHMLLENITPDHQHIDAIFFAASATSKLKPGKGESADLKWYTKQEVETTPMPDDVRILALEALSVFSGEF